MEARILNGSDRAQKILLDLSESEYLTQGKKLISIVVGDDKNSHFFSDLKIKRAQEIGLTGEKVVFNSETNDATIISTIETYNTDDQTSGIVVQLPTPSSNNRFNILQSIDPQKDVDCLNPENLGRLVEGTSLFISPVVLAILEQIKSTDLFPTKEINYLGHTLTIPDLKGVSITILGSGLLVGKPLTAFLLNHGASVQVCDENTKDISLYSTHAQIVITGTNGTNVLSSADIADKTILIDVGNDIYKENFMNRDIWFSTNPGGVGPLTVAYLLYNTCYNNFL